MANLPFKGHFQSMSALGRYSNFEICMIITMTKSSVQQVTGSMLR